MDQKELVKVKKDTADLVLSKVQSFQKSGELDLPPNYSAANALKSAWLILQETVDKDKNPALMVCEKSSIANALLDMVVQGLNPVKKQCYFIVYGKKLTLQRSYFGTKAVSLRVNKTLDDIFAEVIYQGDSISYKIVSGRREIGEHEQRFENINDANIIGAYAVALGKDGAPKRSEIMNLDQLKQAWKQSKMYPVEKNGSIKPGSTHGKFTAEMAKKTVTNRMCKHIINTSSDSDLVIVSVRRTDTEGAQMEAQAEVDEKANAEPIDVTPQPAPEITDDGEMTPEEIAEVETVEKAESGGPDF